MYEQGKRVFDAAFYRFNAIQNSTEYMVRNKGRTFGMWCLTFLIPVVLMTRQGLKDYVSIENIYFRQRMKIFWQ